MLNQHDNDALQYLKRDYDDSIIKTMIEPFKVAILDYKWLYHKTKGLRTDSLTDSELHLRGKLKVIK